MLRSRPWSASPSGDGDGDGASGGPSTSAAATAASPTASSSAGSSSAGSSAALSASASPPGSSATSSTPPSSPPPSSPPGASSGATRPRTARRRDRHGRGLRGALTPDTLPGHRTRAEQFDDLVLDAVELLERRWAAQLAGVEFAVEDVPPSDPAPWEHGEVPLGRLFPASGALATRIVVYRRPVETRAPEPGLLAPMVHEVVVEQVAHLLGVEPSAVDPTLDDD